MFITVQQTRLFLVTIGAVAALVLALDLARVADHPQGSPGTASYQGTPRNRPGTAAHLRVADRASLGHVLVMDVGYNEGPIGYSTGIDHVMRAARAQGATGVVWVTLRETRDLYRQTNAVIRRAAKRWPNLRVADWNAFSAGHSWFA